MKNSGPGNGNDFTTFPNKVWKLPERRKVWRVMIPYVLKKRKKILNSNAWRRERQTAPLSVLINISIH